METLPPGDSAALDDCLRRASDRLRRLARQMLRDFPTVRRWADTDDVLQNTLIRLERVLRQWQPASDADFHQMAAPQMRRALLDLARFYARRERGGLQAPGERSPEAAESADSS